MIANLYGKISNEIGEIVAEGACDVDEVRGSVTLRPLYDMPLLERQHGNLRLSLDDGSELILTDRVLHFRLNIPGSPPGSIYRLYIKGQEDRTSWRYLPEPEQQAASNTQQGSEPAPERDPDKVPPDLHRDPPPPEFRR